MKFYVAEKLGQKQSLTPEGFLLCEDVPINRTGVMIYGPGETPVEVDGDGIARVERDPEEVFRPETIASFQGKPVVNEHPDDDVTPDNWNHLAVGVVLNPHRGVGILDDTLLADLLITNPEAIEDVKSGKREVSCGYDADYEQTAPGKGRQKNIIGNHVALVDSGRCGPRCSIGDTAAKTGGKRMTIVERIKEAFKKKDEGALTAVLDEIGNDGGGTVSLSKSAGDLVVHTHVHTRDDDDDDDDKKHKAKDAEKEEKEKEEEERKKTRDAIKDSVFADSRFTDLSNDVKAIKDAVMHDDDPDDDDDDDDDKKKSKDAEGNRKIEGNLEEEAPPGTSDKAAKARDSAYLEDSFQQTVALAEIIAPGISAPSFDLKAKPTKTYDSMCQFRRRVLDFARGSHAETRNFMDELLNGRELEKLPCSKVRDVFQAVGVMRKNMNNSKLHGSTEDNRGFGSGVVSQAIKTPADLNKRMAEIYK